MLPENVTVLGDPHLGRKFKTGVPLHRVGDRENQQWEEFTQSIGECHTQFHVNMGDLFDKFEVPPRVVLQAYAEYRFAAAQNPNTTYIVIMGNHDVSRDTTKSSSFDIFAELVDDIKNIIVVKDEPRVIDGFGFVPFSAFRPTEELVDELPDGLEAVFGHWDIQEWGGNNVIPTQLLADKEIFLAVSGHDHLAREEKRHGVEILVTGSMQPYTHAEDTTGEWYVTITLDELEGMDVSYKNVRVLLREGETLPDDLDCLSLTAKRITDDDDTLEVDTSDYDTLDLKALLARALEDCACQEELVEMFTNGS